MLSRKGVNEEEREAMLQRVKESEVVCVPAATIQTAC